MKKILLILFLTNILFPIITKAQQLDPVLAGVVEMQTIELNNAYKKRNNLQETLIATQGAITGVMATIHDVENKVLEYMQNASAAMDNIYQLKQAAELISVKIPNQMKKMAAAVPKNIEGSAVTALTTKTCTNVITEMTSLSGFISDLVTNSRFSFNDGKNSSSEKHNVNLLSAAERYYIANEVVYRLQNIHRKLWLITWQIENLGWEDAWRNLDSKSWAQAKYGKQVSERLIRQWKNAKFK